MKIFSFFCFLLLNASFVFSQELVVSGKVVDKDNNKALIGASVSLKSTTGTKIFGAVSQSDGKFIVKDLKPGAYILNIKYIGYETFTKQIILKQKSIDLETIKLTQSSVITEEVMVYGKQNPVVVKEDTTEISSDAFKVNKDATAEELITKMPGVVVQDGKVQAQGEDVKKVLVDGKPFFGDDPNTVIKNIPAEVIQKIQVFDQLSEQAQFTGFDDGNTSKAINIVTKVSFRGGVFGKISSGYGYQDKYFASGNVNIFNNEQRITFLGMLNNINEQNFSSEDLLGVMSQSGGGRRSGFPRPSGGGPPPGGPRGGSSGSGGFFRGGDASNFLVDSKNGIIDTKSFGVNFQDQWWKDLEISGSYFFNQTDNNSETFLNRNYFLEIGRAHV